MEVTQAPVVLKWILAEVGIRSPPPSVFCSKHSPFRSDRYRCPYSFSVTLIPIFKYIQPHRHTDTDTHTPSPRMNPFRYHKTHVHTVVSLGIWVSERSTEDSETIIRQSLLCVCFILCLLSTLTGKGEKYEVVQAKWKKQFYPSGFLKSIFIHQIHLTLFARQ